MYVYYCTIIAYTKVAQKVSRELLLDDDDGGVQTKKKFVIRKINSMEFF